MNQLSLMAHAKSQIEVFPRLPLYFHYFWALTPHFHPLYTLTKLTLTPIFGMFDRRRYTYCSSTGVGGTPYIHIFGFGPTPVHY